MQKFILSFIVSCGIFLGACSTNRATLAVDPTTLSGLKAMGSLPGISKARNKQALSRIRETALQEVALSAGAQAGLACRAKAINEELTQQARVLDTVFDFNSLLLDHNILPPVLLEGRNTLNLADEQTIRISDRTYKIARQAHFVTTPPTWRQYLWMDYKPPEAPHLSMLPKTRLERQVWDTYVERGWKNGIEQANVILEESVARIKEDFAGMVLYRKLLAMNMVSPPFVANTDLGVTGDSNEMHIDDHVLRITALPTLNINSEEWKAAVAKDENALEHFKNMEKLAQSTKIVITDKAWQPTIAPVNKENNKQNN